MHRYIAFLRGINVGGKSLIRMADLAEALSASSLKEVKTYIQSGNVLFSSAETDKHKLGLQVSQTIQKRLKHDVDVAVFSASEWKAVIAAAPAWWGHDPSRKHNILILTQSQTDTPSDVMQAIGELKPGLEKVEPGNEVLYQSLSWDKFGQTTSGKLASSPMYKRLTIRNYNTATKLAAMVD